MKRILKALKWFLILLSAGVALISLAAFVFLHTSPQFGGVPTALDLERYQKSQQYQSGIFLNEQETNLDMGLGDVIELIQEYGQDTVERTPKNVVNILKTDRARLVRQDTSAQFLWFGHSALLLQIDQKNILLDPMLSLVPAPHPMLGTKRFNRELPIEIQELPLIDVVIISHDHYDHLDYESIVRLKDKTKLFYVPLGVGAHLKAWGVADAQLVEFDWWEERVVEGTTFAFTPSRHFSGRGLMDRFKTLWGSWVIKGKRQTLYFSGDGGYGAHFKAIGAQYGPFDLAFMECGQYNQKWENIHLFPEQSLQAALDLKAKVVMPIHWGSFTLALHSWREPVRRIVKKGHELGIPIVTPQIGALTRLDRLDGAAQVWWE